MVWKGGLGSLIELRVGWLGGWEVLLFMVVVAEGHVLLTLRQLVLSLVQQERLVCEGLARDDVGAFHATVDEDLVVEFLGHVPEIGRRNILFLCRYKTNGQCVSILLGSWCKNDEQLR